MAFNQLGYISEVCVPSFDNKCEFCNKEFDRKDWSPCSERKIKRIKDYEDQIEDLSREVDSLAYCDCQDDFNGEISLLEDEIDGLVEKNSLLKRENRALKAD